MRVGVPGVFLIYIQAELQLSLFFAPVHAAPGRRAPRRTMTP